MTANTSIASFYTIIPTRCVIAVTGQDAADFLQGQITNDIRRLNEEPVLSAAMLNPQGRFLYDLFLFKNNNGGYYLAIDRARKEAFLKRLKLYTLRADVVLTPCDDLCLIAASGRDILEAQQELWALDPRLATMGYIGIVPFATLPERATAPEGFLSYERMRYSLGVPDGVTDLIVDKTIILEANFDELNGIAWDKGCYLGQELMARAKHVGVIRKRYMPYTAMHCLPAGAEVYTKAGEKVGRIISSHELQGFALLRQEALQRDISLLAQGEGEDICSLRIGWPPYLPSL